jgi:hypothetical protein
MYDEPLNVSPVVDVVPLACAITFPLVASCMESSKYEVPALKSAGLVTVARTLPSRTHTPASRVI